MKLVTPFTARTILTFRPNKGPLVPFGDTPPHLLRCPTHFQEGHHDSYN